jgi:hypothetical protein
MILSKLSSVVGMCALLIGALLLGLHTGFDVGLEERTRIFFSSETGYQFLVRCYFSICLWLLFFITGTLINKVFIARIICISSLCLVNVSYYLVYQQKLLFLETADSWSTILQISLPLDISGYILVSGLLLNELVQLCRDTLTRTPRNYE